MNLKLYPLDRQMCPMQIASYGWATDDLVYLWKKQDPVQIGSGISLPRFVIEKYSSDYCNVNTSTGLFRVLDNFVYSYNWKLHTPFSKIKTTSNFLPIILWTCPSQRTFWQKIGSLKQFDCWWSRKKRETCITFLRCFLSPMQLQLTLSVCQ